MISAKLILTELNEFHKFYLAHVPQIIGGRKTRAPMLRVYQVATIIVLYHVSHFADFKAFYNECARKFLRRMFPRMPEYSWFLRMRPAALQFLCSYIEACRKKWG
jgi:hypothetical protein